MNTKEQNVSRAETIMKSVWSHVPGILAAIPPTAVAGKIMTELKKIVQEVKESEKEKALAQAVEKCGGAAEFVKELRQEIKMQYGGRNPRYMNFAVFLVAEGESFSKEEQMKLEDTLKGELEAETKEIATFVNAFREEYFSDNYDACENAIETDEDNISFNFCDMTDHPYDEDDLKIIMDKMNEILGRKVFCEYIGFGTDDSVMYNDSDDDVSQ